jgi:3-dehydroquinate synthase
LAHHHTIAVALGGRAYDVILSPALAGFGAALASVARVGPCVVVTDAHVAPLWLDRLEHEVRIAGFSPRSVVIPAGEANKTVEGWWQVVDGVLGGFVDRRLPVIALGGGVVGDLAGFAAATVMRGLPFVQVPTTLLAMVDSSVGGKTGFDHPRGKNLVGAFHQPRLVWAPLETLATLPDRERRAGLGEVVKHALIEGEAMFTRVEGLAGALIDGEPEATLEIVAQTVRSKAGVVVSDELEQGRRAILNLGHTVAHAVEAVAGYGTWLHGEAVAIGLVAEQRFARRFLPDADPALVDRLRALIDRLGLPSEAPNLDTGALCEAAGLDKKTSGAMLSLPLCSRVGHVDVHLLERARLVELFEPS